MKRAGPTGPKQNLPAENVDAYLARLPEETRAVLEELRRTIRAAAPKAEEVISYGMPAYKYHGPLVFFGAFRDHCSLFAVGKTIVSNFARELAPFRTSSTTIHFSATNPLPARLVRKIVKLRVKENEARFAKREREKRESEQAEATRVGLITVNRMFGQPGPPDIRPPRA